MPSYRLAFLFLAFNSFISLICAASASVGTPLITPAPSAASSAVNNGIACSSILQFESICESYSPGFASLSSSQRARCLCYSGTAWNPDFYDNIWGSCLHDISTADTSLYSSLKADGITSTPCKAIGQNTQGFNNPTSRSPQISVTSNVPAQTKTTGADLPVNRVGSGITSLITTAPSAASSALDHGIACSSILKFESICESYSPGFASLSSSQRATCLCYSGTAWDPSFYDNIWGSCLNYISTAETSLYSSLKADGITSTPCKAIGEVTQNVDKKSTSGFSNPQPSFNFNAPASSTATRAGTSSTSLPTAAKGSSSGTGSPTPSANKNGVGSGIELRGLCLLAGLMSTSLFAVLFL